MTITDLILKIIGEEVTPKHQDVLNKLTEISNTLTAMQTQLTIVATGGDLLSKSVTAILSGLGDISQHLVDLKNLFPELSPGGGATDAQLAVLDDKVNKIRQMIGAFAP